MNQDFLPPKNDIVFRLLFGDIRNVDLLSDFLKSVLSLSEEDLSEITIVDPHLLRKYPDKKLGILDLKAKTKSGKIVYIEAFCFAPSGMRVKLRRKIPSANGATQYQPSAKR
jgi:predicted transposase/invertase (TIGR01784 family)